MKYIRKQQIITTITDRDITKEDEIISLLNILVEGSVDLEVAYRDPKTNFIQNYDRVRIDKIDLEKKMIDLSAYMRMNRIRITNIPFDNVMSITLVSDTNNIIMKNENIKKFDFVDIS